MAHEERVGMHWFWRVGIAVVVASLVGHSVWYLVLRAQGVPFGYWDLFRGYIEPWWNLPIALVLAPVPIAIFVIITKRFGPQPRDPETRCRKCGYILRGLVDPRCSECGERI